VISPRRRRDSIAHPWYATKATWKYSDPLFRHSIPTKLDQWTGSVVSNVPTHLAYWWLGDSEVPVGVASRIEEEEDELL